MHEKKICAYKQPFTVIDNIIVRINGKRHHLILINNNITTLNRVILCFYGEF